MNQNQQDEQAARLRRAREEDKRYSSAASAAEAMGVAIPTYQAHENGNRGFLTSAARYADFYRINLEWLLSGRGPMKRTEGATPSSPISGGQEFRPAEITDLNIRSMPMNLPVYGTASCGRDGIFEWNGQVLDHVRRPPRLMNVPKAYAVFVEGESMAPWREHGELAYVHPGIPPKNGDYVVVQLKPTEEHQNNPAAYIKRLVKQTATQLVLHQYNPAGDISIPLKQVKNIHRIMPWSELMTI